MAKTPSHPQVSAVYTVSCGVATRDPRATPVRWRCASGRLVSRLASGPWRGEIDCDSDPLPQSAFITKCRAYSLSFLGRWQGGRELLGAVVRTPYGVWLLKLTDREFREGTSRSSRTLCRAARPARSDARRSPLSDHQDFRRKALLVAEFSVPSVLFGVPAGSGRCSLLLLSCCCWYTFESWLPSSP